MNHEHGQDEARRTTRPERPPISTERSPIGVERPAVGTERPPRGTSAALPQAQPHRPLRPHQWFAERLLAVLSGQRPVHWMLGHTIGEAYDQLAELALPAPR